jgi:hypothetical protein
MFVVLGDLSPKPPGIYRIEHAPAEQLGQAGSLDLTWPLLRFARLQIGARGASQRCPILRWSKVGDSRSRSPGGL